MFIKLKKINIFQKFQHFAKISNSPNPNKVWKNGYELVFNYENLFFHIEFFHSNYKNATLKEKKPIFGHRINRYIIGDFVYDFHNTRVYDISHE